MRCGSLRQDDSHPTANREIDASHGRRRASRYVVIDMSKLAEFDDSQMSPPGHGETVWPGLALLLAPDAIPEHIALVFPDGRSTGAAAAAGGHLQTVALGGLKSCRVMAFCCVIIPTVYSNAPVLPSAKVRAAVPATVRVTLFGSNGTALNAGPAV